MIETILVAVDGPEHANRAIALASNLAQKYDARLIALHVMMEPVSDHVPWGLRDHERVEIQVAERSMLESESEQIVSDAKFQAQDKGAPKVETVQRSGDAAAMMLEVAKDQSADLIVIGSRGLGRFEGWLLGGVSYKVSQLCQCSCIIVK